MKARVKATGEIVDVCFSPTNCMEAGGKRLWKTLELEFFSLEFPDTINSFPPTKMFDEFPSMEMCYDPQTMTAKFVQDMHIRITKKVVGASLAIATDKQLRDELQRRAEARKALKDEVMRCQNCKHCIQGYTTRRAASRGYKTSVCEMRPKDKEWRGCFYSTLHSRKACDMFEKK